MFSNPSSFTRVPFEFFETYLKCLSSGEIKLLLWIIHRSRNAPSDITNRQFQDCTGCSNRTVTKAINDLVSKGLIVVLDNRGNVLPHPKNRAGKHTLFYQLNTRRIPKRLNPACKENGESIVSVSKDQLGSLKYLEKLHQSPYRPHNILAYFIEHSVKANSDREQIKKLVQENLPIAQKLESFSDKELSLAVEYLINVFPGFTLDDVYQYLIQ